MKRIIYIDNFLHHHGYAPVTGYTLVSALQKQGFEVIPVSNKKNQLLRLLHMLAAIIWYRKNAVVLIATYSTSAFYFAYSCARLCRLLYIPYVPCLHGGNLPERINTSPNISRRYFGNSFMNVAVSGYLQQAVLVKGWYCTVIPNAILLANYSFKLRATATPKLLWVRSLHKVYNPQMAIQVLQQLRTTFNNAVLTVVGPDKDGSMHDCMQLARSLGISDYVHFTGQLSKEQWTQLAAAHDIFINTTTADNLPVSVIEAMALGMIVVSTNAGGLPYLVEDGVNGLLVNSNDVSAMVNAIMKVIQDRNIAAMLSNNARESSLRYDEETVIQQWKKFLYGIS